MAPSPTAEATRFTLLERTSPTAKEAQIWSVSTGVTAIPFFKLVGSIAGINLLADSGGFIIILVVMVMIGFVAYFIAFLLLYIMERTESN